MSKIAVGADHGGFPLKVEILKFLAEHDYAALDLGTDSEDAVDYPDYASAVCETIATGQADRGILVCGSGVGVTVAANKFPGIRAGMCHDSFSARQGREDDNTNVLCLGSRVIGVQLALDIVRIWLAASFSGAARHVRRLEKVSAIERRWLGSGDSGRD